MLKALTMMSFGSKFQFLLQMCLMMIWVNYVFSMNCDIDNLIGRNCYWTLWTVGLIWLCMMELKL